MSEASEWGAAGYEVTGVEGGSLLSLVTGHPGEERTHAENCGSKGSDKKAGRVTKALEQTRVGSTHTCATLKAAFLQMWFPNLSSHQAPTKITRGVC